MNTNKNPTHTQTPKQSTSMQKKNQQQNKAKTPLKISES